MGCMETWPTEKKLRTFPVLWGCLQAETVFMVNDVYVGRASDGTEVQVGNIGREAQTESYLAARPTPDLW